MRQVLPETRRPDVVDQVALCAASSELDPRQVAEIAEFASQRGESLQDALVARGRVDETSFVRGLASLLGLEYLDREPDPILPEVLKAIPPALAASYQVVPLGWADGHLRVACWDAFDWQRWDELECFVAHRLRKVLCPRSLLAKILTANYGLGAETVAHLVGRRDGEAQESLTTVTELDERDAANEPTVVNLVNRILSEAIRANATDIHLEPYEGRYRIRYRIDGMLEDVPTPAAINLLHLAVVSRVKIMSGLDITEKRLPQDGRSRVSLAGQDCDLRISILPGIHGEAMVIRILNQQAVRLDLPSLGFEEHERSAIDRLIKRPFGLFLVTGPTGSGKTTTLYACVAKIRSPQTKIVTIEDPVEYWMDDILQMQVHEEIGFTFARALRSTLRHDPDVILVGEIRDHETAEIAIRSALTGHLVLASLHTNDAASATTRLCDIGIEPFLVASSVQGILAQRLLRRVCQFCKMETSLEDADEPVRVVLGKELPPKAILAKGKGCEKCRFTGYHGRMAAGEVLTVSSALRQSIQDRQTADVIKEIACREGLRPLRANAIRAALAGETTLSEVLRVTQEEG